jgi:hypothetical protein
MDIRALEFFCYSSYFTVGITKVLIFEILGSKPDEETEF